MVPFAARPGLDWLLLTIRPETFVGLVAGSDLRAELSMLIEQRAA